MVDLPKIPRRFVTAENIQDRVTPGAVAAPYQQFAQVLEGAADLTDKIGARMGETAGEKAVTIGPDGLPKIEPAPFGNWGAYGRAREHAALAGFGARMGNKIEVDMAEMQARHMNDPAGFATEATAYNDRMLAGQQDGTPAHTLVARMVADVSSRTQAGLIAQKSRVDIANSKDSINARIERLDSDLGALARQGGTNTEDFKQKSADLKALYGSLSSNPLFGEPPEKTALSYDQKVARFQGDAILGKAERYMQAGDYQSVVKLADEIDTIPNLTDSERVSLSNGVRRYAREQQAVIRQERTAIRQEADVLTKGMDINEVKPDDLRVGDAIDRARQIGDFDTVSKLSAKRDATAFTDTLARLPAAERAAAWEQFKAARGAEGGPTFSMDAPTGDGTDLAASYIRGAEAPKGSSTTAYEDTDGSGRKIGTYRVGYGSDTVTLPDGSVRKTQAGDRITQADAERDLTRRLKEQETSYVQAVGMERWQQLPPGVKAAAMSVMWNYGTAGRGPNAIVKVINAGGGPQEVATAIRGLKKGDFLDSRREDEATMALGGTTSIGRAAGVVGSTTSPLITRQAQMTINMAAKGYQSMARAEVDRGWADTQKAFTRGFMPDAPSLVALAQNIAIAGDTDKAKELTDWMDNVTKAGTLDTLTASQLEPVIASMNQSARDGGLTAAGAFLMDRADKELTERNKMRESDPIGLSEQNGIVKPVAPIDWSNQQGTLDGQLRARGLTASSAADFAERPAVSIFKPAEKTMFTSFLQQAPVDQAVRALGSMADTIPGETLGATMRDLGGDANARPYTIAASFAAQGRPETAKAIILGQRILAENPTLRPKPDDVNQATATVLPPGMFPAALTDNSTGQPGIYADTIATATAIYASKKGPQGTKDFDEPLWGQAVEEAVGGFVYKQTPSAASSAARVGARAVFGSSPTGDGQKVIAPLPGMTQPQFSQRLATIPDAVLQRMDDGLGNSLTRSDFMDSTQMEALGSGQYLLKLGRGYVLDKAGGRPFVLDLR